MKFIMLWIKWETMEWWEKIFGDYTRTIKMVPILKESKLSLDKMMHAHILINHHAMLLMNAHGANQLLLKVHANQLKLLKHSQLVSLPVINLHWKFQLNYKKHAHMQIKQLVMELMNAHGANQLLLKVLANQLKLLKHSQLVSLHVINFKKKNQK